MALEPQELERVISAETGLLFKGRGGVDNEGQRWYLLRPRDLPQDHTFGIRTTLGWRRLTIDFEPGKFAGELLGEMGKANADGRAAFRAVLTRCYALGAKIDVEVNDKALRFDSERIWEQPWSRFKISLITGPLDLGTIGGEHDARIISSWTGRFAAGVVAILPLENKAEEAEPDVVGYPEGAIAVVQTNRYERDRRNRAAAIAIHGYHCKGCGLDMGRQYGAIAEGFIEVHHVTPVSQLGADYVVDPEHDLVPLCPNCHAVVHRQNPPLSIAEIQQLLKQD